MGAPDAGAFGKTADLRTVGTRWRNCRPIAARPNLREGEAGMAIKHLCRRLCVPPSLARWF
ncbi:hypothetical protein PD5205_00663 [Xanthomonas fragariae]|uniref:Uncharacterized protein n=1 Tax=Xanthomonas fragariae TaxID=48664 RepID=A0A1Y6HKP0_9XANT|nr:hypothetical protein PD885_03345 [Xanthomonas fragariae]SMR01983.1 hypothetical protein PD5205_00663 [Xanthomonas fragariae]